MNEPKAHGLVDHPDVARQRDLAAAAKRKAVDGRHHRNREAFEAYQGVAHDPGQAHPVALREVGVQGLLVAPAAERRLASPGHDHHPKVARRIRGPGMQLLDGLGERRHRRPIQGVVDRRTVDRQHRGSGARPIHAQRRRSAGAGPRHR